MIKENDRRLKPIDVSKYTVTESGNVIRTDNKETLKNALERITELEIENAELRAIAENQQSSNMERYFKNKELEKENAELKEAIKHFNPCGEWNDDVHDCEFIHYAIEYGSKLTKAKEIILTLLNTFAYPIGREDWTVEDIEVVNKAEQFLKGE